jgi:hypothetical protein
VAVVIDHVAHAGDFAVVENAVRPVFFALVLDLVRVQLAVDFLEEFEAYDAVVGGFVEFEGRSADLGVLGEDVVDSLRVEDFIDAAGRYG